MNLKTQDMHVFSQQLLPLVLPHVLHPVVRVGIIRLSVVFHKLFAKVVMYHAIPWLQQFTAYWNLGYYIHLIIHLANELVVCSLVLWHWMYPIERYMGS